MLGAALGEFSYEQVDDLAVLLRVEARSEDRFAEGLSAHHVELVDTTTAVLPDSLAAEAVHGHLRTLYHLMNGFVVVALSFIVVDLLHGLAQDVRARGRHASEHFVSCIHTQHVQQDIRVVDEVARGLHLHYDTEEGCAVIVVGLGILHPAGHGLAHGQDHEELVVAVLAGSAAGHEGSGDADQSHQGTDHLYLLVQLHDPHSSMQGIKQCLIKAHG